MLRGCSPRYHKPKVLCVRGVAGVETLISFFDCTRRILLGVLDKPTKQHLQKYWIPIIGTLCQRVDHVKQDTCLYLRSVEPLKVIMTVGRVQEDCKILLGLGAFMEASIKTALR